jgi:hypothetical protein
MLGYSYRFLGFPLKVLGSSVSDFYQHPVTQAQTQNFILLQICRFSTQAYWSKLARCHSWPVLTCTNPFLDYQYNNITRRLESNSIIISLPYWSKILSFLVTVFQLQACLHACMHACMHGCNVNCSNLLIILNNNSLVIKAIWVDIYNTLLQLWQIFSYHWWCLLKTTQSQPLGWGTMLMMSNLISWWLDFIIAQTCFFALRQTSEDWKLSKTLTESVTPSWWTSTFESYPTLYHAISGWTSGVDLQVCIWYWSFPPINILCLLC